MQTRSSHQEKVALKIATASYAGSTVANPRFAHVFTG